MGDNISCFLIQQAIRGQNSKHELLQRRQQSGNLYISHPHLINQLMEIGDRN